MPEIVPIAIAFLIGGLLGWLGCWLSRRNRPLQPDARLEEELRQQLRQREQELESGREKITQTSAALAGAEANRDAAQRMLEESRTTHAENLRAAKEAQDKALADLREAFKALSADALRQTAPQFLQLANETFAKFQETAKGDLAARQESIATLVQPLKEQLESYQRRLQQSETSQAAVLGEVKKQLEGLAQNSQALSSETFQLRRVLSSNQARGRWGEETLRRVVEAAGMSPHCDFSEQAQADDKKPDMIVRLPGNRLIIVDAKVPDLDFLRAIDSADPAARDQALTLHANKLKETIRDLAKKDYPAQFPAALDYVVLFLPAESLFSAALEADRDLILWAAQRQIMLATPASLIALLRAVSVSWQQHAQTENAREIAATAQDLFSRVVKFFEHFEKIRGGLEKASGAYNDAMGSYERMVRPSGEKLMKLGGGAAAKELPEIAPLEMALRLPSNGT
ncbi:MAG TPA: DNA recombination protein RmuC [Candidatus Baltobacteraceae bacterium]|nr:DNA recombination protein RmuC [Candidatus Baltobacteraceae bacterium]